MSILLESRPPAVSVRAGCAALALSRASYYRYSSNQTAVEVAANDAVPDDVPASDGPAMVAETTSVVAAAVPGRAGVGGPRVCKIFRVNSPEHQKPKALPTRFTRICLHSPLSGEGD